jgi:hypothetical protein
MIQLTEGVFDFFNFHKPADQSAIYFIASDRNKRAVRFDALCQLYSDKSSLEREYTLPVYTLWSEKLKHRFYIYTAYKKYTLIVYASATLRMRCTYSFA